MAASRCEDAFTGPQSALVRESLRATFNNLQAPVNIRWKDAVALEGPKAPSLMSTIGQVAMFNFSAISKHQADSAAVSQYELAIGALEAKRKSANSSFQSLTQTELSGVDRRIIDQVFSASLKRVRESRSVSEIDSLLEKAKGDLKAGALALSRVLTEARNSVEAAAKAAPAGISDDVRVWKFATLKRLDETLDGELAQYFSSDFVQKVDVATAAYNEKVRIRRAAEKRIDLKDEGSSQAVWKNTAAVFTAILGSDLKINTLDASAVTAAIDAQPALKNFLYHEMQIMRRFGLAARTKERAGLRARVENDLELLKHLMTTKDATYINKVLGLRGSIRRLIDPAAFAGLTKKEMSMTSKIDVEAREMILKDSLREPQLAFTVAQASVIVNLPKPPTPPREPGSRTPPSAPSRSASRSRWMSYKSDVESFKSGWNSYKRKAAAYKEDVASYKVEMQKVKEVLTRRAGARRALLVYIGEVSPRSFGVNIDNAREAWRVAEQQLSSKLTESQRAQVATVRSQIRTAAPDHEAGLMAHDWIIFALTGNPMWLINRDVAMFQLFLDLAIQPVQSTAYLMDGYQAEPVVSNDANFKALDEIKTNQSQDLIQIQSATHESLDSSGLSVVLPAVSPSVVANPESGAAQQDLSGNGPTATDTNGQVPNVDVPGLDSTPAIPDLPNVDIPMADISIPDVVIPDIQIPDIPTVVDIPSPSFDSSPSPSFDSGPSPSFDSGS